MPRYQVRGTVYLIITEQKCELIDEVYDVADEVTARQKALDYAEECWWGDEVDIDDDDLEVVCIDTNPDIDERIEAKATYAWMKAINAPTLFDQEQEKL